MEKKSAFCKVILLLCFGTLLVNVIETNQIRLQTKSLSEQTLIQKIMYKFPVEVKLAQKIVKNNYLEFTVKDKNITERISAPVVKVSYNYWGEPYNENRYYTAKDENNRLVYASLNIKSLYHKKANLNELVMAKLIYADKYEFDCFSIKTTEDKTDFTPNISLMPLQSENVYFIAEMPKNFVNSKESINLELFVGNNKYVMKLR